MLQADFVAVAQLLVYAGAVMVMFLFVIAYLGDRADLDLTTRRHRRRRPRSAAGLAILIETVIAVSELERRPRHARRSVADVVRLARRRSARCS